MSAGSSWIEGGPHRRGSGIEPSGRFECVDEVTLMLEGQEADRGLGRVR